MWLWPLGTLVCFCRAAQSNFTSPPTPPPPCYSLCIHILSFYLSVPALPCFMTEFKMGHHVSHCIEERVGQRWPGLDQCHYCTWFTNQVEGRNLFRERVRKCFQMVCSKVQYVRKGILHFLLRKYISWWWNINNFFFPPYRQHKPCVYSSVEWPYAEVFQLCSQKCCKSLLEGRVCLVSNLPTENIS